MLRTGLALLMVSTFTIVLRFQEIGAFQGPQMKLFCMMSLALSLIFFAGFYLSLRTSTLPRPHRPLRAGNPAHALIRV